MKARNLIANSSIAAVVSNPRLDDNPIVDCNAAFTELTGFDKDEIVGRNCRFLRGPETEEDQTQRLRDAIRDQRPTMVEITNYKKDGTPFLNAVMIAPIFGDDGKIAYYLGSQVELDRADNARPDASASRLIEKLTPRQKQVLALVANGLLNKQIAFKLGLKERTVKMHRADMIRSLGVRTTADAIRLAIEAGL